mgnify:CR=1 FL=1
MYVNDIQSTAVFDLSTGESLQQQCQFIMVFPYTGIMKMVFSTFSAFVFVALECRTIYYLFELPYFQSTVVE